jgi:multimeric flavodoxin WrbA
MAKKVLVVYYSLGGNTETAAKIVAEGIKEAGGIPIIKKGLEATTDDLLSADALAVGTPDYFSYMAGGVKDFFDRTFYPTQGKVTGKPYGTFVTHGGGGAAGKSLEDMSKSFKFRHIADTVLVKNKPDDKSALELKKLGKALVQAV